MKFLKLLFVLVVFFNLGVAAHVGCRIGNYILTDPTGGNYNNGGTNSPIYSFSPGSANTINKRNWSEDPQCGILRNVADSYPLAPGGSNNPNSSCSPSNNYGDIGKLVYYNPADNNCAPANVPLDDYIWVLLLAFAGAGFIFLNKRESITT
jgi:hypothetical protein